MALSTSYYTVDGEIIGESANGTRLDYLNDALGSVTAKVDQAGSVASTARYKPYGDLLSGSTYIFGWVGSYGYRKAVNGSYVRARHYEAHTSWQSIDDYWPTVPALLYAFGNPVNNIDPTGKLAISRTSGQRPPEEGWPPICDFFVYRWIFRLLPKDKTLKGWLIQLIEIDYTGHKCPVGDLKLECDSATWYEAWLVYGGEVQFAVNENGDGQKWQNETRGYNDKWIQGSSAGGGACTYGRDSTKGKLMFVRDPLASKDGPNDWLTTHGFFTNQVNCSGSSPSTHIFLKKPGNMLMESKTAVLDNSWGCCSKTIKSCNGSNTSNPLCPPCEKDYCIKDTCNEPTY